MDVSVMVLLQPEQLFNQVSICLRLLDHIFIWLLHSLIVLLSTHTHTHTSLFPYVLKRLPCSH